MLSGSHREPGRIPSTTSSSASMSSESGSQAHHAHDFPELGGARVVDTMPSPSSSEVGPTVLDVEDESSTSDAASGSVENMGTYVTPTLHFTNPTQHATTPHATTTTPRVGAHGGRQRKFRPSSEPVGSVHTVQTGPTSASMSAESESQVHHAHDLPEHGRASVVDTMPSPSSSEVGPPVLNVKDESSMSDASSGSVVYRDDHAPTGANTQ